MSRDHLCSLDEQCLSNITLIFIGMGVCLTLPSLLWPIDPYYNINPVLSAQENEALQEAHSRTITVVSIISFVGMGLIGLGAVITSALLSRMIVVDICFPAMDKQKQGIKQDGQPKQKLSTSADSSGGCQGNVTPAGGSGCSKVREDVVQAVHLESQSGDKERLVALDHLKISRDFSQMKPYGSIAGQ